MYYMLYRLICNLVPFATDMIYGRHLGFQNYPMLVFWQCNPVNPHPNLASTQIHLPRMFSLCWQHVRTWKPIPWRQWRHADARHTKKLNCSNVAWICMKCCTMNTEPHLFNSFEIILENSFAPLDDNVISNTIDSIDSLFSPTYASSPQFTHSNHPSHATANRSPRRGSKPDLPAKSNWRSMVVNVNHLHHKRAVFDSCTTYVKPDVIFGTEAKLDPSTNVQEIFPPDYQKNCFINYRNRHGGGTFIAVKNCYTATELQLDSRATHRDVVWVKVSISGEKPLYLCSFYRAPGSGSAPLTCLHEQLNEIARIADEKIINIAGDFNCPNID